jgi:hypothetical protein
MRKCHHREFRQKRKSVPAFVGYCVPHLTAVCVLYTEIKNISTFLINGAFYYKLNLALLFRHSLRAICRGLELSFSFYQTIQKFI